MDSSIKCHVYPTMPDVQHSRHVRCSSQKFCKSGSPSPINFHSKKAPIQPEVNTKLNFLEATSTNIFVQSTKFNPRITGKSPPFNILNSWSQENDRTFTWSLMASVISHRCPSASKQQTVSTHLRIGIDNLLLCATLFHNPIEL